MPPLKNEIGSKYNRLTVIGEAGRDKHGRAKWLCLCDCGTETTAVGNCLRSGHKRSCGCYRIKHGLEKHPLYGTWSNMKQRCYNPNTPRYAHYGGRGITVCNEWRDSFPQFLSDMGERPEGTSLDRIDVNGDYTPDNCRWATKIEQNLNRRANYQVAPEFYKLLTEPIVFEYREGGG